MNHAGPSITLTVNQLIGDFHAGDSANGLLTHVTDSANALLVDAHGNVGGGVDFINSGLALVGGGTQLGGDLLTSAIHTVNDGGSLVNHGLALASQLPGDTTSALDTLHGGAHDPAIGTGMLQPLVEAVTAPADAVVSHASTGYLLLDAQASVLMDALPAADNQALVNADTSVLAHTETSPHATGLGLVDADSSLLSHSTMPGVTDGVSITVNLNALTHDTVPAMSVPVVDLNMPLPTASSIPILSPITDTVADVGHTIQSHVGSTIDHSIDLAALTHSAGPVAAIDAGVLFTGGSATIGHESSGAMAPVMQNHDVSHTLSALFGHH